MNGDVVMNLGKNAERLFSDIFPDLENTTRFENFDFVSNKDLIEVKSTRLHRFTVRSEQHTILRLIHGFYAFMHIQPDRIDIYFVDPHDFDVKAQKSSIRVFTVKSLSRVHLIFERGRRE